VVCLLSSGLEKERLMRSLLASEEGKVAYYKLLVHVWCSWDPSEGDLEEIGRRVALGEESVCTLRQTLAPPQAIAQRVALDQLEHQCRQLAGVFETVKLHGCADD
jgi:hypothetical protein